MGGKHFGELYKIRGLITYKISPYEQRAFAGMISHGLGNSFRRFREQALRVIPRMLIFDQFYVLILILFFIAFTAFVATYMIYNAVEAEHHHSLRKNPKDFENDQ